jgi:hypothetical protein
LATVLDAYSRKGRSINTLQDFSFKMVHQAIAKHTNVDALSLNPADGADEWEDIIEEIQDCKLVGPSFN